MQIVVIGGCGVLGQALLKAIIERGVLTRSDGVPAPVHRLIAVDRAQPPRLFVEERVEYVRADPSAPRLMQAVMGTATDSVFHAWDSGFRGIRSTPSFALSDSLRDLFAACELQSSHPKVVLASSFAADCRGDALAASGAGGRALPASRDGMTALVGELLLEEETRDGQIIGRALRLPMVAGAPGCASFLGDLVPALAEGRAVRCAIPTDAPLWLTSPQAAARALVHAHELSAAAWAQTAVPNAPGRTHSVDSLLEALTRLAGRPISTPEVEADAALIEELAQRPHRVAVDTALTLGFEDGPDADALVRELVTPAAR
jgi:nucleoside-diphosphate-sugar epimerase